MPPVMISFTPCPVVLEVGSNEEVYTADGKKLAYDDNAQAMECKLQTNNYVDKAPLTAATPKTYLDGLNGLKNLSLGFYNFSL